MPLSNYLAKAGMDHELGGSDYARPATVYIAQLTSRPKMSDTGSTIVEADYTGYERLSITNNATNFPATVDPSATPLTSGVLEVGRRYLIDVYETGDDFANVGAPANTEGVVFVASGTTPTVWTGGSEILQMGAYKTNGVDFEFAESTGDEDLSEVGWIAILEADEAGNMMYYAEINPHKTITKGDKPRFPAGSLKFYRS